MGSQFTAVALGWFCSSLLPGILQPRLWAAKELLLTSCLTRSASWVGTLLAPRAVVEHFGVVAGKLPTLRHLEVNRPAVWVFWFCYFKFFFLEDLNLQASLVGIFFQLVWERSVRWRGKGLVPNFWMLKTGESGNRRTVLFTTITSTPPSHVGRSPPQKHVSELFRKAVILSKKPFHMDLMRNWIELSR